MDVPKGVTVMIDAGAVFKLRGANIDVGSSTQNIDRSLGAVQVLGTPSNSVYFTSYLNERIGVDTYANTTTPSPGDWGGLVFHNDYDYADQATDPTRRVLEQEGIFLDYVNHANISYGGGKVTVNGVQAVYDPIHMIEARPTVSFNTITHSADAALSADPNSLLESEFHDSFGESLYTLDYDRVGPDIHGNTLVNNSLNALFLRVQTAAGQSLQELGVTARYDDVDTVLAIPQNLVIQGDAGEAVAVTGTCPLTASGNNQIVVPAPIAKLDPQQYANPFADRQSFTLSDTYTDGPLRVRRVEQRRDLGERDDHVARLLGDADPPTIRITPLDGGLRHEHRRRDQLGRRLANITATANGADDRAQRRRTW